jgi:PAS domain-containing protein
MPQYAIELILLKQLASYLALPVFIADAEGDLLFYNEPAEALLGRRYDEAGEMPVDELATIFALTEIDGTPIASDDTPIGIALLKKEPAHHRLRLRGLDGVWRTIEATAFPIEGHGGSHLGAVAMFWEVSTP